MSDRNGNTITITRSGGLIQRLTSPSGRYLDFTYNTTTYEAPPVNGNESPNLETLPAAPGATPIPHIVLDA